MLKRFLVAAAALWAMAGVATAQLAYAPVANDGTTGTVVGKLAKFTSAGAAITLLTSDTTWTGLVVGETVSTASPALTGNAILAIHGPASCIFDGTTVIGDYVTISGTVAGDCKDTGAATYPTSGAVVGIALAVNGGAGTTASTYLIPPGVQASSGAFSTLTGGTNAAAAMVVGTGASLATSGTGTISPSTPVTTTQGTGATVYSYKLTGNAYAGANGGTGEFFGLGYNVSGDKELIVGDFDNVNTTNACLNIQSAGGGIRLLGAFCNNAGTANINFGGTTGVTGVVSSTGIFLQDNAGFGYLSIPANNTFHWGNADAASATAQTIGVQGVVAGTSNVAGANTTFAGSVGTGTGAGGSLLFQVAPAAAGSATTQNALVTGLTIADNAAQGTKTTVAGSLTVSGIASTAQADVVCTTATGLLSYQVSATGCAASAMRLKNPEGSIDPQGALQGVMQLRPAVWTYKQADDWGKPHVGLYADDVCAMDDRLCARMAGKVENYDKNGTIAYLVAAVQAQQREIEGLRAEMRSHH